MKLTLQGIQDTAAYEKAGIRLPDYDISSMRNKTIQSPRWVHFGIGNIFRIFIGGIAEELLNRKECDTGIVCEQGTPACIAAAKHLTMKLLRRFTARMTIWLWL